MLLVFLVLTKVFFVNTQLLFSWSPLIIGKAPQKHSFDRQVVHETTIKSEQMFLTEVYSRF